jgi:hypothetical protein
VSTGCGWRGLVELLTGRCVVGAGGHAECAELLLCGAASVAPRNPVVLAGISLCDVCSCYGILRAPRTWVAGCNAELVCDTGLTGLKLAQQLHRTDVLSRLSHLGIGRGGVGRASRAGGKSERKARRSSSKRKAGSGGRSPPPRPEVEVAALPPGPDNQQGLSQLSATATTILL